MLQKILRLLRLLSPSSQTKIEDSLASIDDSLSLLLKIECLRDGQTVDHLRNFDLAAVQDEEPDGEIEVDDYSRERVAILAEIEKSREEQGLPPLSDDEAEGILRGDLER